MLERYEDDGDGRWVVRPVPGAAARKPYRCPGCDHEIRAGVPHIVAWPAEAQVGVDERRHWHTACWRARAYRRGRALRKRRPRT